MAVSLAATLLLLPIFNALRQPTCFSQGSCALPWADIFPKLHSEPTSSCTQSQETGVLFCPKSTNWMLLLADFPQTIAAFQATPIMFLDERHRGWASTRSHESSFPVCLCRSWLHPHCRRRQASAEHRGWEQRTGRFKPCRMLQPHNTHHKLQVTSGADKGTAEALPLRIPGCGPDPHFRGR